MTGGDNNQLAWWELTKNWLIGIAVLCGYPLLVACSGDDGDTRQVYLTVANHTTPGQLADASEYLIRGAVISSPQPNIEVFVPDVLPEGRPPVAPAPGAQRAVESMAGFAAYDESIPETSLHPYWVAHDDLNSLSRSSDIAFVGRVTGYTEAVLVVHDDPAEEPDPTADVYDGVVFTVDELLVGELPADETQVTIATRVLMRNKDGTTRFRVSASPIETVRPGIFARNEPDRQRYIVYALAGHKETPFYATGIYFFNTPGGVAPVLANDRIGTGAARPLTGTSDDSSLSLDDARAAAKLMSEEETS